MNRGGDVVVVGWIFNHTVCDLILEMVSLSMVGRFEAILSQLECRVVKPYPFDASLEKRRTEGRNQSLVASNDQ